MPVFSHTGLNRRRTSVSTTVSRPRCDEHRVVSPPTHLLYRHHHSLVRARARCSLPATATGRQPSDQICCLCLLGFSQHHHHLLAHKHWSNPLPTTTTTTTAPHGLPTMASMPAEAGATSIAATASETDFVCLTVIDGQGNTVYWRDQ